MQQEPKSANQCLLHPGHNTIVLPQESVVLLGKGEAGTES
jgi:hypothetical protein